VVTLERNHGVNDAGSNGVNVANPYIGPKPFTQAQAGLFFGRDRESRDLLAQVLSERLVLFYAQSGAGKTSLINSRLIPGLAAARFRVLPVGRVSGLVPDEIQPHNVFIFNLISRLVGVPDSDSSPAEDLATMTLAESLARDEAIGNAPSVLIIDQFEEIFTTRLDQWHTRGEYFQQLAAAQARFPRLWIVLVMREDYIAQLDPLAYTLPNRLQTRFYMQRMSGPAALQAIKQPAAAGSHPFAPGVAETLVETLQLVRPGRGGSDTQETVPGEFVEPVQLQVVCYQFWNRLSERSGWRTSKSNITEEDLRLIAGDKKLPEFVNQALREYYEQALRTVLQTPGIDVTQRELRDWFSNKLLTANGTRALVLQGSRDTGGLPDAVVKLLDAQFLIRAEPRGNSNWYELAHDRLIEPVNESNAAWLAGFLSPWQQQAALWNAQHRPPSMLLSGEALADAEHWAEANPRDVSDSENALLEESRKAQVAAENERRQRRNTLLWALAATLTTLLALVFAGGFWNSYQSANDAATTATNAKATALAAGTAAEQAFSDLKTQTTTEFARRLVAQARIELQEQHIDVALLTSRQASLVQDTDETRAALRDALDYKPGLITFLHGPAGASYSVAFNPLQKDLVAAGGQDAVVRLWNTTAPQPVAQELTGHTALIYRTTFSPDGKTLATAGEDRKIRLWNVASGLPTNVLNTRYEGFVHGLAFSPDGNTLAWAGEDGLVYLRDLLQHVDVWPPLPKIQSQVQDLTFSREGILAAAGRDENIILWDTQARIVVAGLAGGDPHITGPVQALAFSPDGHKLASGGNDGNIRLWNVSTRQVQDFWRQEHGPPIRALAYSPDGQMLASANEDGTIGLWDVSTQPATQLDSLAANGTVLDVAFSPDGKTLASVGVDGKVWLWNAARDLQPAPPESIEAMRDRACRIANRNLTDAEWTQFAGSDVSKQAICPRAR
jgi:conflict system STAND superfamily ATPase/WD40 domain-containing protein